jgi:NAD dependent epimerase/dehydratase family enzyme
MSKIVIAGASGFIGKRLQREYEERGHTVVTIGRSGNATWDNQSSVNAAVDGAELLINMAGKNVGCRYHDAARNEILSSRLRTTRALHAAVTQAEHPPALWLNSSTATIYRHATDRPQTESAGELGQGFSVDVARNWEREFFTGDLPGTRRVALRMAIVLGDGPATNKLLMLARFGLGGPQIDGWALNHKRYRGIGPDPSGDGNAPHYPTKGNQRFSWIHIDDVVRAVDHIVEREELTGPVNLAAPGPVTNRELMSILRKHVGAPFGLPSYRWMLEPAMFLARQEPEMLLKSRWVLPEALEASGFEFRWPDLGEAVATL